MSEIYLALILADKTIVKLEKCVNVNFVKEIYTPYTKCSGEFVLDDTNTFTAKDVKSVTLFINGTRRHFGIADKITISKSGGKNIFSFTSRGYTLLLGQNEPYPKTNPDVNLSTVISKNLSCPYISCEPDTPTVNYIYVKEKSTVWDAVTAYCLKAKGNYPYISGENKVMLTNADAKSVDYSKATLTKLFTSADTTLAISDVYMKDVNGEYTYSKSDESVKALDITREKYYPLDYQWLNDTDAGLKAKLDFAKRGINSEGFTYFGTLDEDLKDKVVGVPDLENKRVSMLEISASVKGIFTTISCYNDFFAQK